MQKQWTKCRYHGLLWVVFAALLTGCEAGYYWQAVTGHTRLMQQARPVNEVIADEQTAAERRADLQLAIAAVEFAHARLALPDNGSYRTYVELDRPSVVWNVLAAPVLSLTPRTWCFPVAGCVSYRGYFDRGKAQAYADELEANGEEVYVSGAIAYSTLGRFSDPLLSSMLDLSDQRLAGVVFHELAHQRLYVADDSAFNEGFASFVEQQGLRRWLLQRAEVEALCDWVLQTERQQQVEAMLTGYRRALEVLYDLPIDADSKLAAKAVLLETLPAAYRQLRSAWLGPPYFDHWFNTPFNNARFALLTTYAEDIPAFAALLDQAGGDLESFYRLVETLAAEPVDQRRLRLEALKASAPESSTAGWLGPECAEVVSTSQP